MWQRHALSLKAKSQSVSPSSVQRYWLVVGGASGKETKRQLAAMLKKRFKVAVPG